ncbi:MAG TPA: hypothetical protein DER58_01255, partial [Firmicutes bacterium]|nr:hypothetical protein [Bacillota bacterium]
PFEVASVAFTMSINLLSTRNRKNEPEVFTRIKISVILFTLWTRKQKHPLLTPGIAAQGFGSNRFLKR